MVAESFPRFAARSLAALVSASLGFLALHACGSDESTIAPTTEPAEPDAPDAAPETAGSSAPRSGGRNKAVEARVLGEEAYDSTELGALHGTILFRGEVPERFLLGAAKSEECKHHPDVDQRSNEVVVNDGKLAYAFVHLDSGFDTAKIPPAPASAVVLGQRGCMYVPRALAVRVGQPLLVENGDPTTHNVHVYAKRNAGSNLSMGAQQKPLELRFDKPEQPIKFRCDIHPWMGAEVYVESHPWFAVSDEAGRFRIEGIPPGEYVVEAAHESLGKTKARVRVDAGKAREIALEIAD